ncbi:MAG: hypothetical protein QOF48_1217 [Verrucomicrobiota bacterium]
MKIDEPTEGGFPTTPPASRLASNRFLTHWLPVVLWCAIIFGFSGDAGSSRRTSRIIGPLLRWFIPDVSDEAVAQAQWVFRKASHMVEYAVLACLAWRTRRPRDGPIQSWWRWRDAGFAWAFATVFAVSDEIHQAFVPTREARVLDVVIDAMGALMGLLAMRAWGRCRGR